MYEACIYGIKIGQDFLDILYSPEWAGSPLFSSQIKDVTLLFLPAGLGIRLFKIRIRINLVKKSTDPDPSRSKNEHRILQFERRKKTVTGPIFEPDQDSA